MLPNTTDNSGTDKNLSDPAEDLINEICIVFANNTSFVARMILIRNEYEFWFESKSGQRWMVARRAITSIRPLHHAPEGR
jgi:hypothetical protein